MTPNNNFNVLPFYESLDEQDYQKEFAHGFSLPIIAPNDRLLPFQIRRFHSLDQITSIRLWRVDNNSFTDIETETILAGLTIKYFSSECYDLIINPASPFDSLELNSGSYYLEVKDDNNTWYSEVFHVVENIDQYLKLEYWDTDNIAYKDGHIDYSDDFKNFLYIDTKIGKPEYPFEEEVQERDGYLFVEKQISEKRYKFNFLATEALCDALRVVRMHDYINIYLDGATYEVDSIVIEPKWQKQGNIAVVEVEFDCDTAVKKVGKGMILPDPDPVVCDVVSTFQGYDDFNDNNIDTGLWTVTNDHSPNRVIEETFLKLRAKADGEGSSGDPFGTRIVSTGTFVTGTVQGLVQMTGADINNGFGIWVDSNNHAVYQGAGGISGRVRILVGGTAILDQSLSLGFVRTVETPIRVSVDGSNNVKFDYYDGTNWINMVSQSANIGTNKSVILYTSGGSLAEISVDSVYISDQIDYTTSVPPTLIFQDDFEDNSIDTGLWTVTNNASPARTVAETGGKLSISTDGSDSGTPFDTYIESDLTITEGAVQCDLQFVTNQMNFGFGLWVDSNNHAVIMGNGSGTNYRLRLLAGGSVIYDTNTAISGSIERSVRVTVDADDAITFQYWDGTGWATLGTPQTANIGTNKKAVLYSAGGGGSASEITMDNFYMDKNPAYTGQNPLQEGNEAVTNDNDEFNDLVLNENIWTVVNAHPSERDIEVVLGQLKLTATGGSSDPFGTIAVGRSVLTSGTIQADLEFTGNNTNFGMALWVSATSHAVLQCDPGGGSARLRILNGGSVEYDQTIEGVTFDVKTPARISRSSGNVIKFEYWNGSSWVQMGTDQTVNFGTSFSPAFYVGGASGIEFTVDNFYATTEVDYTTIQPTNADLPPRKEDVTITDLFNGSDQFVVAELGQSNMEGRDGDSPLHTVPVGTAYEFNGSSIVHLTNDRGGATGGSHATYFAEIVTDNTASKKPVMTECATGGTGLGAESGSGSHWGDGGGLRDGAETKINAALTAVGTTGLIGLWGQGERDAQEIDSSGGSYTVSEAKVAMQALIDWWFGLYPDSIFIIAQTGAPGSGDTVGWQQIRQMQQEIANENARVFMGFDQAYTFITNGKMADNLHYNYLGYRDMGQGLAKTLISVVTNFR